MSDTMLIRLRPRTIEPRADVPAVSAVVSPVPRSSPEADAALCGRARAEDALPSSNLSMTDVTNSCSDSSAASKTTKRSSMASSASRAHGSPRSSTSTFCNARAPSSATAMFALLASTATAHNEALSRLPCVAIRPTMAARIADKGAGEHQWLQETCHA